MGDPKGFLRFGRKKEAERAPNARVQDFREFVLPLAPSDQREQAARCMDCGVPFCHKGCPLENLIPEWNDHVYRGRLDEAARALLETNNFPEITSRVCPAPCEAACVLNIENTPVTIKSIERVIADHIFERGLVAHPRVPATGHGVAIVGSGPAGLAAAQELVRLGHAVTVFERADRVGGLLRYGIPDFKLERAVVDARIAQLSEEGVVFRTGVAVGRDIEASEILATFDRVLLATGATKPRDLSVPGRDLEGVLFAMDYLEAQNRRVAGENVPGPLADGKRVVVLGGGDTGSDCVGTARRQGALQVTQLEILERPPLARAPSNPWPEWPYVFRTSSSQEEGCDRDWALRTVALEPDVPGGAQVGRLRAVRVAKDGTAGEGTAEVILPCDLVLLAMGFLGQEGPMLAEQFGATLTDRGNFAVDGSYRTTVPRVFAAGDASRGQSLVVWAIADGRKAARAIHESFQRDVATGGQAVTGSPVA